MTAPILAQRQQSDLGEIKRALTVLFRPEDTVELRALRVGPRRQTHGGYFRDFDKLAGEAARLSGQADGIYVVLNEVDPALFARAANRVAMAPEHLTQAKEIRRRRWLPIDIDAKRPVGISSSDEEHTHAIKTAYLVRDYLVSFGFAHDSIVVGDSGNGGHVLARIDLPNDAQSEARVRSSIRAVAERFDSERITIDQSVYDAARLWKLPGTLACKGDNIAERPHRIARLLEVAK